jgi:hypothetical protein
MKYVKLLVEPVQTIWTKILAGLIDAKKYVAWILKKGTKWLVAIWIVSVAGGLIGWVFLIERWFYYLNILINQHSTILTAFDTFAIPIVMLYLCAPAWIGYYLSDRKLFYDEFMKDSSNY